LIEVLRRKRQNSDETCKTSEKPATFAAVKVALRQAETRTIFAPLRTTDMYIDTSGTEAMYLEDAVPTKTGRPPHIILTSAVNLITCKSN
jgi:hypothetical protein